MPYCVGTKNGLVVTWLTKTSFQRLCSGNGPSAAWAGRALPAIASAAPSAAPPISPRRASPSWNSCAILFPPALAAHVVSQADCTAPAGPAKGLPGCRISGQEGLPLRLIPKDPVAVVSSFELPGGGVVDDDLAVWPVASPNTRSGLALSCMAISRAANSAACSGARRTITSITLCLPVAAGTGDRDRRAPKPPGGDLESRAGAHRPSAGAGTAWRRRGGAPGRLAALAADQLGAAAHIVHHPGRQAQMEGVARDLAHVKRKCRDEVRYIRGPHDSTIRFGAFIALQNSVSTTRQVRSRRRRIASGPDDGCRYGSHSNRPHAGQKRSRAAVPRGDRLSPPPRRPTCEDTAPGRRD